MNHKDRFEWPLYIVIAMHLAVVIPLALLLPVWDDEIYSMRTASHGLIESLRLGVTFERQAPLYFGILSLLRKFSSSPLLLRTFSIVCTTATLWVASRISRGLYPKVNPAWIAGIIAWQPLLIFAAIEIRVYALEILLVAILILLFIWLLPSNELNLGIRPAFIIVATLSLYAHYYIGFLLGALALALVVTRRNFALRHYLVCVGCTALLTTPIVFWLRSQLGQSDGTEPWPFSIFEACRFAVGLVRVMLFPAAAIWADRLGEIKGIQPVAFAMRYLIFLPLGAAAVSAWRGHRSIHRSRMVLWWVLFVGVALALSATGAVVGRAFVVLPRYWAILVVPAAMALWSLLVESGNKKLMVGFIAAVMGGNAQRAWQEYRPLAKKGDAARVATYIQSQENPNQPIIVFPNFYAPALEFYYHGFNRIVAMPNPVSFDRYNLGNGVVHSECEISQVLKAHTAESEYLWLVFEPTEDVQGLDFHSNIVQDYCARNYNVIAERNFYRGLAVKLLHRRTPQVICPLSTTMPTTVQSPAPQVDPLAREIEIRTYRAFRPLLLGHVMNSRVQWTAAFSQGGVC